MKKHLGMLILPAVLLAAACNRGNELQRDQQQYDVVQEGAGGAVTSTIHAPGEVMPPLTNTNADTTTEFMLPNITDPSQTAAPPGSLAETFPTESATPPPRTTPRPAPAPQPAPQPPPPTTYEPQPEPQPPPPTTTTVEPQPEEPEPEPEQQPEPQPPPPPPPPTDTTETDTAGR